MFNQELKKMVTDKIHEIKQVDMVIGKTEEKSSEQHQVEVATENDENSVSDSDITIDGQLAQETTDATK